MGCLPGVARPSRQPEQDQGADGARLQITSSKVIYTAKTHTTGGRDKGVSRSSDGRLDVRLSVPGGPGTGTNPEQLLAAGWSACFESALALEARRAKVALPPDLAIDAEVDLNLSDGDGYFLRTRLNISLPDLDRTTAQKLVEAADHTCPYSKAMRGNIDVVLTLV
jgi:osmotically inducible protein OsmC